ncbi:hypothetical protein L1987_43834 [Smallanthus sonchifolius]|uniref:Uncharacterized protein n=1 Tax=Smallanthus sonchifolius TaxID=185202 RepID=A0ACB9GMP8_9ASTR|nr:hypothetical protein L1987_43834 [Smallanthus sonchifolius]
MQHSGEINDIGFSPSFNCYSGDNLTSTAAAKVSREIKQEHASEFQEFSDIEEEDFEFSFEYSGEKFSSKDLAIEGRILLPIFNTDLVTKDDVDHDDSSAIIPVEKMLPSDSDDTPSSSSSEAEELENTSSGTFCVSWRKAGARSPAHSHIKKSRSTGSDESGSRRWKIKDILRRSNSLGKETVYFLCPKMVEASCKKRLAKSGEGPKATGLKSKTASSASIHELFYVQKLAEQKGGNMKSYLPYRQDILGFKVHINGNSNKKLPF